MRGLKAVSLMVVAASAGSARAQDLTLPVWTARPDLVIDGARADFSKVIAIAADQRGFVYIAESGDQHILVFDSLGAHVRTLGRKGAGPGEFKELRRVGVVGDSVWAADGPTWSRNVLTVFRSDGRLVSSGPVPAIKPVKLNGALSKRYVQPFVRAVYPDGTLLSHTYADVRDKGTGPDASLIHSTTKGDLIAFVATRPESPDQVTDGPPTSRGYARLPFSVEPLEHVASDGSSVVEARAILTGDTAGFVRVTVIRASGDTAYSKTYRTSLEPIPDRVLDSAVEASAMSVINMERHGPRLAALVRAAPRARYYPTLRDVKIARDGSVLLGFLVSATAPDERRDYLVLDPTGVAKARFTLPRGFGVHQFETDRLWATVYDSDGFPSIVRYRLGPSTR